MEASFTGKRGGEVGSSNYDQRLWDTPHPLLLLQLPWKSPVGGGRQLYGGGAQNPTVVEEVCTADVGVGMRGSGCPDFENFLCGSCAGGPVMCVGDMGNVIAH